MATIPRQIRVHRDTTGVCDLYIDGELFPHALDASEGIDVQVVRGRTPLVRVTLLAHSVDLTDDLLLDVDTDHDPEDPA